MAFFRPYPTTKKGWLQLLAVLLLLALIAGGVYIVVLDRLSAHYLHKAQEASRKYNYEDADRYVKEALRYRSSNAEAHLLRAQLLRRANQPKDAEEHLQLCRHYLGNRTNEAIE